LTENSTNIIKDFFNQDLEMYSLEVLRTGIILIILCRQSIIINKIISKYTTNYNEIFKIILNNHITKEDFELINKYKNDFTKPSNETNIVDFNNSNLSLYDNNNNNNNNIYRKNDTNENKDKSIMSYFFEKTSKNLSSNCKFPVNCNESEVLKEVIEQKEVKYTSSSSDKVVKYVSGYSEVDDVKVNLLEPSTNLVNDTSKSGKVKTGKEKVVTVDIQEEQKKEVIAFEKIRENFNNYYKEIETNENNTLIKTYDSIGKIELEVSAQEEEILTFGNALDKFFKEIEYKNSKIGNIYICSTKTYEKIKKIKKDLPNISSIEVIEICDFYNGVFGRKYKNLKHNVCILFIFLQLIFDKHIIEDNEKICEEFVNAAASIINIPYELKEKTIILNFYINTITKYVYIDSLRPKFKKLEDLEAAAEKICDIMDVHINECLKIFLKCKNVEEFLEKINIKI